MVQPPHTRLLTTAARKILRPLGLSQKGRSRLWTDDHGWWLIVVEFQPSGWSKGSYLNVGAMWLWEVDDFFAFHYGDCIEGFASFKNELQFMPLAENLARRAADEVERLRLLFPTVGAVAQQLAAKSPRRFWDTFHAGMSCGLAGEMAQAARFFDEVINTDDQREWAQAAVSRARAYSQMLVDVSEFRRYIEGVIRQSRAQLRLPEVIDITLD